MTDHASADVRALTRSRRTVSREAMIDEDARRFLQRGVAPDFYAALRTRLEWAWGIKVLTAQASCEAAVDLAEMMILAGASPDEALSWLTVWMCSTGPDDTYEIMQDLRGWRGIPVAWADGGVPASLASIGWAAGLSPADGISRYRAGTLDPEDLMFLASLREFRLPDDILTS